MKAPLHTIILTALALVLQGAIGIAHAQQQPIVLKSVAESEVDLRNAQGVVEKKRVPLTKALPGAVVIYTTTFTNQGAKPAANVVITNPVPENTTYVADSAFGDHAEITYSIDGGKTFNTPSRLITRTADGRERAALPGDYTHIRWAYLSQLPPGDTGTAGFRVLVK
jgi:uncharacterized repeat protein (TIGR01451 family)